MAATPGARAREWHGRPGWPPWLRRLQLQGLMPLLRCAGFGRRLRWAFRRWQRRARPRRIVDLASGTGGAVAYLLEREPGAREATWVLTDARPEPGEWRRLECRYPVRGHPEPVRLPRLPDPVEGAAATLVAALHELEPAAAAELFAALCRRTVGFLVVEPMASSRMRYLAWPLIGPAAAAAPLLGAPRSPLGWFLSTLLPVLPLIHLHDGLASLRRAHSATSVTAWLAAAPPGWEWEVGEGGPWFLWAMAWCRSPR